MLSIYGSPDLLEAAVEEGQVARAELGPVFRAEDRRHGFQRRRLPALVPAAR